MFNVRTAVSTNEFRPMTPSETVQVDAFVEALRTHARVQPDPKEKGYHGPSLADLMEESAVPGLAADPHFHMRLQAMGRALAVVVADPEGVTPSNLVPLTTEFLTLLDQHDDTPGLKLYARSISALLSVQPRLLWPVWRPLARHINPKEATAILPMILEGCIDHQAWVYAADLAAYINVRDLNVSESDQQMILEATLAKYESRAVAAMGSIAWLGRSKRWGSGARQAGGAHDQLLDRMEQDGMDTDEYRPIGSKRLKRT